MHNRITQPWLYAAIVLSFVATIGARGVAAADPRPNFVVIFFDDLGYGDLSCFGAESVRTPRMDQMAAEGMRLTSFYAQNVCGPSRAALLTGCYPIRVAEPGNKKNPHTELHPKEITLAEVLHDAGYATGMFGKWHNGGNGGNKNGPGTGPFKPELMPNAQGFDYWFGTPLHNGTTRKPGRFITVLRT